MKKLTLIFLSALVLSCCDSPMDYPMFSPKPFNNITHPLVMGTAIKPSEQSGKFTVKTRPGFFEPGIQGKTIYLCIFDLDTLELVHQFRPSIEEDVNIGPFPFNGGRALFSDTQGNIWSLESADGIPRKTGLTIDFSYGFFYDNLVTTEGSQVFNSGVLYEINGKPSLVLRLVSGDGKTIQKELVINTDSDSFDYPTYDPQGNRIIYWNTLSIPKVLKAWNLGDGTVDELFQVPGYLADYQPGKVQVVDEEIILTLNYPVDWNQEKNQETASYFLTLSQTGFSITKTQTWNNTGYQGILNMVSVGTDVYANHGRFDVSNLHRAPFSILKRNPVTKEFEPYMGPFAFGYTSPSPLVVGKKLIYINDWEGSAKRTLFEVNLETKTTREKTNWIY